MAGDNAIAHFVRHAMERELFLLATVALLALAEPPVPQYGVPGGSSLGGYSSNGHSSGGYSPSSYSSGGYSPNGHPAYSYSSGGPSGTYPGGFSSGSSGSGFGSGGVSGGGTPMFSHEQDFQRSPGVIWGKWSVVLPDGRTQRVEYDADENGFHPIVTFDDPRDGSGGASSGGYANGGFRNGGYTGTSRTGGYNYY